jgi:putative acetyltransferase
MPASAAYSEASLVHIREYRDADIPEIARLYYETVHRVNARDYGPEQIEAWAPEVAPDAYWRSRFERYRVFVAEEHGMVTGFAEIEQNGHIDCFYVHHTWQRCGVGTHLMRRIEREARQHRVHLLFADVSITARPFFERMGFGVVMEQKTSYRGCEFTQYFMAKRLNDG